MAIKTSVDWTNQVCALGNEFTAPYFLMQNFLEPWDPEVK